MVLIIATVFCCKTNAQEIGLNIGDKVPDFVIPKIYNSSKKTARLSDFKDQLLIVDFWLRTCAGCVEALPGLERLQKKFQECSDQMNKSLHIHSECSIDYHISNKVYKSK